MLIFLSHSHLFNEVIEFDVDRYFYKAINNHLLNRDIKKLYFFFFYLVTNIVVLDIDVLYPKMEDWVLY